VSSRASRAGARGFTLLELLVVIAVLAILASLVSPMIFRNVGDAKVTAARTQLEALGLSLDAYRLDNDYYPSTAQGLDALVRLPTGEPVPRRWRGPYLKRGVPADPWGRPYEYRLLEGDQYELLSRGRDGTSGGDGEDADLSAGLDAAPR
jgi:general secretion pathway protein G